MLPSYKVYSVREHQPKMCFSVNNNTCLFTTWASVKTIPTVQLSCQMLHGHYMFAVSFGILKPIQDMFFFLKKHELGRKRHLFTFGERQHIAILGPLLAKTNHTNDTKQETQSFQLAKCTTFSEGTPAPMVVFN